MKVWHNLYPELITKENIFRGWKEFRIGKKKRKDVVIFERNLDESLNDLYLLLKQKTYKPGSYTAFYVKDPKIRLIHKALVVDRVVHHIVSGVLEKIFEPTFFAHSYSCREDKGTHKGLAALQKMARKVSRNNTRTCWSLKFDVKKFFASVNHRLLLGILTKRIADPDFLGLLTKIVESFSSHPAGDFNREKGIPIGNLTSQIFANIYLNELDQFVKHELGVKHYIRYADDFIILSYDKTYLEDLIGPIEKFLRLTLDLELHPDKIIFRKLASGVDFLGYVIFPHYVLPRARTKKRILRKIKNRIAEFKAGKISEEKLNQTIQSYLGYLTHANAYKFRLELQNSIWYWLTE